MRQLLADVAAFHAVMGCGPDASEPLTSPPDDVVRLRAKLIGEEFTETIGGMTGLTKTEIKEAVAVQAALIDLVPVAFDLEAVADGLADLIYVCVGSALAFGIPLDRVWAEVQRANMAKAGGPRREDGKCLKPEGWKPPDIHAAIWGEAA